MIQLDRELRIYVPHLHHICHAPPHGIYIYDGCIPTMSPLPCSSDAYNSSMTTIPELSGSTICCLYGCDFDLCRHTRKYIFTKDGIRRRDVCLLYRGTLYTPSLDGLHSYLAQGLLYVVIYHTHKTPGEFVCETRDLR